MNENENKTGLIYKKLGEVMGKIGAIDKARKNVQQGFMFRGIDDFMNALHGLMAEAGIIILPSEIEHIQETFETTNKEGRKSLQFRTRLHLQFTFASTEDGSTVTADSWGEAADNGDKGYNKCKSIALKYVLMQMFLVPTKDIADPDKETPDEVQSKTQQSKTQQSKIVQDDPDLELALLCVKEAKTLADLQKVWADNKGMQTNKAFYDAVTNRKNQLK